MANYDSDKFGKILSSIERNVIMQSSFMESMFMLQTSEVKARKEEDEDRRRELDLVFNGPNGDGPKDQEPTVERGGPIISKEHLNNFFGSIMRLGILGIEALTFRNLIAGGFALAMAGPIQDFVAGATSRLLEQAGMDEGFSSGLGEALGRGAVWAAVGSIFGRKIAMIFGLAGITSSAASSLFENQIFSLFDQHEDGIIHAFGLELDSGDFGNIGMIMGGAFGAFIPMMVGAVGMRLGSRISAYLASSTAEELIDGGIASRGRTTFINRFRNRFLLAGGIAILGNMLGSAVGQWTGSDELGTAITTSSNWAAAGAAFGPQGAVVAGLASLAYYGISGMLNWMRNRQNDFRDATRARLDSAYNDWLANPEELTVEQQEAMGASMAEIARDAQLVVTEAQQELNRQSAERIRQMAMSTEETAGYILPQEFAAAADSDAEIGDKLESLANILSVAMSNARYSDMSRDDVLLELMGSSASRWNELGTLLDEIVTRSRNLPIQPIPWENVTPTPPQAMPAMPAMPEILMDVPTLTDQEYTSLLDTLQGFMTQNGIVGGASNTIIAPTSHNSGGNVTNNSQTITVIGTTADSVLGSQSVPANSQ